jgi:branched-chain amino acid transport system ATP-binding protein
MSNNSPLIKLEDVGVSVGSSQIIEDLNIEVDSGESVGLIGRNGAGKTTTLRGVMGQAEVTAGSIKFRQTELAEVSVEKRSRLGIGYQPEDRELFTGMTVDENFRLPIWVAEQHGEQRDEEKIISDIYEIFPQLSDFSDSNVENLSGGQAKMTAIGRALALQPDLLLLDEPLEGLAPTIVEDMKSVLTDIGEQGIAVLLAEANLSHASELVDRAYIIDRGQVHDSGSASKLVKKESVQNILQG